MSEINREELAWAAGFIDGEGSFILHKTHGKKGKREYGRPRLDVSQVDRRVLDKLRGILQFGKVYGPYRPQKKNHNDFYLFSVRGLEEVQFILGAVWQWLSSVKQEQAKNVLLAYYELNNRPRLPYGPVPRIPKCHPERKNSARGMCAVCYQHWHYMNQRRAHAV